MVARHSACGGDNHRGNDVSALDKFQSLDDTIRNIKDQHTSEMSQMESRLKSAEIEL